MILFAMMRGGDLMGMGRQFVHFRGNSVCVPWHSLFLSYTLPLHTLRPAERL